MNVCDRARFSKYCFVRIFSIVIIGLAWTSLMAGEDRFAWAAADLQTESDGLVVAVDASELAKDGLLYSRVSLPLSAGKGWVYPKWVPGTHAPGGVVENFGGIRIFDLEGNSIPWERDSFDPWRIIPATSAQTKRAHLALTYIANCQNENSQGVDIFAGDNHAIVNWNCALFYPEGADVSKLSCRVVVRLPTGWQAACALPMISQQDSIIRYAPMSLVEVLDRPLITGSSYERHVLRPANQGPEVLLHVVSQHPEEKLTDKKYLSELSRLPGEADKLFGGSWFSRYDMLLVMGDESIGLEHSTSSLNGASLKELMTDGSWARNLLPHEFVHSWIGKHRRPAAMLTADFQQTPRFEELWIYEGLTELIGRVLGVRSGFLTEQGFREELAKDIKMSLDTAGRHWRSLRDTCRCGWQLRGHIHHHHLLRRSQDYYTEGAIFWLVIHRKLLEASQGKHGIDDVCRIFFGPSSGHRQGFTEKELIKTLTELGEYDYPVLIKKWVDETGDLDVGTLLDGSGWRYKLVPVRTNDEAALTRVPSYEAEELMGFNLNKGWIKKVDPKGVAAKAGLKSGDYIYSANKRELEKDKHALQKAVAESIPPSVVELYIFRDEEWSTVRVTLRQTLMIADLVREPKEVDIFAPLLAPRVKNEIPATPSPVPLPATP